MQRRYATIAALLFTAAAIISAACGSNGPPVPNAADDPQDDALAQVGKELFTGNGACHACHAIDGIAQGVLGPDLTSIGTLAANRIPGYTAERYIRESIVDPCAYDGFRVPGLPSCELMDPARTGIILSDDDVDALVAFLLRQR